MITPFELQYLVLRPFLLPLHNQVRKELKRIIHETPRSDIRLLDVGGRKSHYTIGLKCSVTISDLPRETDIQKRLNLGINDAIAHQTLQRRTNIEDIIFDDMCQSRLPDSSYDIVVAVEVLEHVERDDLFLKNVFRVLKPGGVFLMTTPNGDFVTVVSNPDHKRHYQRTQLIDLLESEFKPVKVDYTVLGGRLHSWGLSTWSLRRPLRTFRGAISNLVSGWVSSRKIISDRAHGTHHLIAEARKPHA